MGFTDFQQAARTAFALKFPQIDSSCMGRGDSWLFMQLPNGQADILNMTDTSDKGIAAMIIEKKAVAWALAWDHPDTFGDNGNMVAIIADPAAKAQFLYYPYITDLQNTLYFSRAHVCLRGNTLLDTAIQRLDRIHYHLPDQLADGLCCRTEVAHG